MSKKARRRKATRPRLSPAQMVRPEEGAGAAPAPVAVPVREARSPGAPKPLPDLREEYPYVVADLRRIGIIALAMLALLIGLALLLV